MNRSHAALLVALLVITTASSITSAQWIHYPTPGLPRTADGKPNLSAPVPRTANGLPDLSGVWVSVQPQRRVPATSRNPVTGIAPPFLDIENFLTDDSSLVMLPAADALYRQRRRVESAGRPSERCLPHGIPDGMLIPGQPVKIVQTPGLTMILYEEFARFRQVFTDGRPFPADLNPSWLGSSIGRWDRDTFVVETAGFNDQTWLDDNGHPHTDALRTTERFSRLNAGSMELRVTFDDPKAYAKPWTIQLDLRLAADSDLIEDVCDNEKDNAHTVKK
jgi:hypothetical protein